MTTHVTTHNRVRSDVAEQTLDSGVTEPGRKPSRAWAYAGIGAGLAGIGTVVTSSMIDAIYDPALNGDTPAIVDKLAGQWPQMFAFHSITVVGALLTVVFAAGLFRRLQTTLADSAVPLVAFAGLLGTAVVSVLGSGLDTEFMMAFAANDGVATSAVEQGVVEPSAAVMYNHWIGTIPWLWVLSGLTGAALWVASRRGAVPRWIGRVGLVLGGLTMLLGISPFEYAAAAPGVLWLLVTAIGFAVGDRAARRA